MADAAEGVLSMRWRDHPCKHLFPAPPGLEAWCGSGDVHTRASLDIVSSLSLYG